jgi:DNA-binding CsgD family transcriptional regulator
MRSWDLPDPTSGRVGILKGEDSGMSRLLTRKEDRAPCAALFPEDVWHALARSLQLSGRELQITRCVFDDQKEQVIASRLGISTHTVHTHLERLYRKLGVASRVELVVRIFTGYLALPPRDDGDGRLSPAGRIPLSPAQPSPE